MHKDDLALNHLQGLICHKTQLTNLSFHLFSVSILLDMLIFDLGKWRCD